MRRIPRIPSVASALSRSSTASAPARSAAACLLKRDIATSSPRTTQLRSQTRAHSQRRYLSVSSRSLSTAQQVDTDVARVLEEEAAVLQAGAQIPSREIQTDLVYPRGVVEAPRSTDVTDPEYTPAETAEGLEEVGGLANWWEDPEHWSASKEYVGFGPQEKVTDPAVLEVLTRRAVVEALIYTRYAEKGCKNPLREIGGWEEMERALKVEVDVAEDGTAALKKSFKPVWADLNRPTPEGKPVTPEISPADAQQLAKSWDPKWKTISLRDPVTKFAVAKRIQRLTGHVVPDGKLLGINTAGGLVAQLIKPPKPKKLAEEIATKSELVSLPNVRVFPRRVTPVDKEKMVGRWKIIVQELEKRELPVVGTGNYGKAVEKKWILGKA